MKKHFLILLTVLLATMPLLAQYSPCYEAAFAEGQRQFKAGNYAKAKKNFNEAKDCPNPNTKAINEMLQKCNQAILTEAEKGDVPISIFAGSASGHDYVDLDLPSGTLWATCNIGASNPEDFGDYYAWGETQTKSVYNWESYRYAQGTSKHDPRLTKYCGSSDMGNNGFTDNLTTLQGSDDPATANWGNGWHTPSDRQWNELMINTTCQWTTRNGVKGLLCTSKKNGESVFLPAAGYRWDSSSKDDNVYGYYNSSDLVYSYPINLMVFMFDELDTAGGWRPCGRSVRPVREK